MSSPVPPYVIGRVAGVESLTPRMRRVTLEADAWRDAVAVAPDQQVKVFLARDGGVPEIPAAPQDGSGVAGWYTRFLAVPEPVRPWMRSYTVRELDVVRGRMVIDFVLHEGEHTGPASRWAAAASRGDTLGVLGPAVSTFRVPAGEPGRLFVGDETALPAMAASVETLPAGCRAVVVAEIADAAEEPYWARCLPSSADQAVYWVHRDVSGPDALVDVLRSIALPDGPVFAWVAGEASAVRAARRHLVTDRGLDKRSISFTGYWRRHLTQDDAPTEQDMADAAELMADAPRS